MTNNFLGPEWFAVFDTFRFRQFEVYQDAKKFRRLVKDILCKFPKKEEYELKKQINRACHSILLNIAEGSAKKSDKEFARFLETAIASTNEVIAGFDLALDDMIISQEEFDKIEKSAESIVKQLGGFIRMLTRSHSSQLSTVKC